MLVSSFQPAQLEAFIRPGLSHLLNDALEIQNFDRASEILSAFIDTWPIASIIETAHARWEAEQDPLSLAVLSRARVILSILGGSVPELNLPEKSPPYLIMKGSELASRRAELCKDAAIGSLHAVLFSTPVPIEPASQLALGELRMEAIAQQSVERYGLPGLFAPDAPLFEDTLGRAPAGKKGEQLRRMCDIAQLPGTPARILNGDARPVGWLLWNGPAKPLPVADVAYQLVRHVDKGLEGAATAVGIPITQAKSIIEDLISLGAVSS
jgi:hypothetical protein